MPFTLTDDPQFYGSEVSLSNILMIDLFSSDTRMVIISKTEKKSYHSKYVKDYTFMASTWERGVLKFVTYLQILFVFKQKIYCSFLQMEGVGGHAIGHFLRTSQMHEP